jgi:hypothetical protein
MSTLTFRHLAHTSSLRSELQRRQPRVPVKMLKEADTAFTKSHNTHAHDLRWLVRSSETPTG